MKRRHEPESLPLFGAPPPKPATSKSPAAPPAERVPKAPAEAIAEIGTDERRAFYDGAVSKARSLGLKPGFAAARYKDKFGGWPPRLWTDQTRQEYERDTFWQGALARRQERRAQEQAEDRALAAPEPDRAHHEPQPESTGSESFADWFDRQR